ncbi:MAG: BMP family ABC transporter substrate-binding protein [Lachnospiraceae bacterium]|nr:BMP family ABC transporter substrate-binding protein [Lachnospiraceae bacterium]MCR5411269.1 BMP family ABC transporter substrate-binding protein [Lachnospiraceae bacterium]
MKKKLIALVLAATMALSLAACGSAPATDTSAPAADTAAADTAAADASAGGSTTDVAFVTDVGNIDDQSFNQYTWAGVQQFCADNGLTANYYKPSEDSDAARVEQMDNAVKDGAKVVVMAGYLFAAALEEAQAKYPDVQFLALDVSTGDLAAPAANTALITYKEEQAGYLAGYAAVTDGYKELGFLGGMAVPAVVRYGYGFVQGAEQAAKDSGASGVNIKYWYSGSFVATDDIKAKMDSWYSEGTEVVFACGGSICNSCLAAAQANNGKMIGVDVDQSNLDPCVVTSAMKALSNSVMLALTDAKDNGWKFSAAYSGKETTLGAAEDCVGLPMDSSDFKNFTQEQYDTLFKSLVDGSLVVDNSFDTAKTPAVSSITVDYQE